MQVIVSFRMAAALAVAPAELSRCWGFCPVAAFCRSLFTSFWTLTDHSHMDIWYELIPLDEMI